MQYDIIESVLSRPAMYTLSGTYGEVVAFLEGYFSGLAKAKDDFSGKYTWTDFLEWLTNELNSHEKPVVDTFKDKPSEEALRIFKQYYLEFKSA
jgi:hypothetical protein